MFKMKLSIIKICVRLEWIFIVLLVLLLVKLKQEQTLLSNWYSNAVISLQKQENKGSKVFSNFLEKQRLVSLLFKSGENSSDYKETSNAAQDFYKRCFFRPAANQSSLNSTDHPHFHGYLIENPNLCAAKKRVDLLVYINSAVPNRERRQAIRHSWASRATFTKITMRLVFLLGQAGSRREQLELLTENAFSGDIVQANFEDSFRNLTYKAVAFMAWANAHCTQAQYVIKVDDDIFVDMFSVVFNIIPKIADKDYAMACSYKVGNTINRNTGNHWYVEKDLLAGQKVFPNYCSGFFSVITGNIIPELFEASFYVKDFIPIDDVYMTGLSLKYPEKVSIVDIKDKLYFQERSEPDKEIKVNGHFEYVAFGLKDIKNHASLWNSRLNTLSPLEERFYFGKDVFKMYGKQSVVIRQKFF